jgi:hypothetical protein
LTFTLKYGGCATAATLSAASVLAKVAPTLARAVAAAVSELVLLSAAATITFPTKTFVSGLSRSFETA